MPRGPNRKILTDGMFLIHEGTRRHLGKIGKVDFAELREAEREIIFEWDCYISRQLSEQNAPDLRALTETIETFATTLEKALAATKAFRAGRGGWLARHEFKATINDLLREVDLSPGYLKDSIENLVPPLDNMATIARVLRSSLARRRDHEEVYVPSSTSLRAAFLRRLHQTLARHGLDTGVGINSLIVDLVLDLQGKASDFADPIERRRKDLAREIKLAVKNPKGG